MCTDDETITYTEEEMETELDSEWRWSLEAPSDPGIYGLFSVDRPGTVGVVILKEEGVLSDGRKTSEISGIWFIGLSKDKPFHVAMFAGPPEEMIEQLRSSFH